MRLFLWLSLLLSAGMLLGCFPRGDPSKPIPTSLVKAPQKAQRLVVVLPGRGDDLNDLRKSGVAQAVQSAWPDADVSARSHCCLRSPQAAESQHGSRHPSHRPGPPTTRRRA